MIQTHDLREARRAHAEQGGYLLQTGMPGPAFKEYHYSVCDESEALDLGRTPEQLRALAPDYDETT